MNSYPHTLPSFHSFHSFGEYRVEIEGFASPEDESLTTPAAAIFLIKIAAKFTTRPTTSSSESGVVRVPGRSALFNKLFSQRHDVVLGDGSMAWDTVASMLSEVHVPAEILRSEGSSMVDRILECARLMANGHPRSDTLCIKVAIAAFLDELPSEDCLIGIENVNNVPNNNNNDYDYDCDCGCDCEWDMEDDNYNHDDEEEIVLISDEDFYDGDDYDYDIEVEEHNISYDDYTIRFEPASEESIEGLEKVRISGVLENSKEITCSVCFEDVLVGSEATRLPCSHLFHGDCVVKWLQISKYCPLCRFELSS